MNALPHQATPLWRDVRFLRVAGQVGFVLILVVLASYLYGNLTQNLTRRGLLGGFDFLRVTAGFHIPYSVIGYDPSHTYGRAFLVGLLNTLQVTVVGIILATIMGVVAGVARLSSNWLVSRLAAAYVEIVRNIPLLVQLFFWYLGVILQLPPVGESVRLPFSIYLSQRGVVLPWMNATASFGSWLPWLGLGLAASLALWLVGSRYIIGIKYLLIFSAAALVAPPVLGWLLQPSAPLGLSVPVLQRFNFQGGVTLNPEFAALLIGLVVYTGAFISENVRAGIQAVRRGQIEAARALGLSEFQILRLVVFPLALRVIIPPTTSQYLNLAKNSSLAVVATGFPDLFFVGKTVINQAGRPVEVFLLVMGSYLMMSLFTSLLMNLYNRKVRVVEH